MLGGTGPALVDRPAPVRRERHWRGRLASVARHSLPRYLALAALGFGVDLTLLWTLHRFTDLPAFAVVSIAFWLTYALNFALNRRLSFHATDGPLGRQVLRFLPQVLADFVLTLTAVLALRAIGLPLTVSRIAAGATNLAFNYVLFRWWTFRRPGSRRPAAGR